MDEIADKIIAKYQHTSEEKKMIPLLKGDPQMRQALTKKIARRSPTRCSTAD